MQITDEMVNRADSVLSKIKGGIPDETIRLALEAALSAPSVAVKALEWEEFLESSYQRYAAKTPFGEYVIELATGQWWNPGNENSPYTSDDPKMAAQAHYDAAIRYALSAQVQDVAGWQPLETAPKDGSTFIALASKGLLTHWMPLPAAPAKQDGN